MVPCSESAEPSPTRKSAPAVAAAVVPRVSGLPAPVSFVTVCVLTYGTMSIGDAGSMPVSPPRSPKLEMNPGAVGGYGDQNVHSSRRATSR